MITAVYQRDEVTPWIVARSREMVEMRVAKIRFDAEIGRDEAQVARFWR
jgi:hypothetical protein